jgi:hypothetical protein
MWSNELAQGISIAPKQILYVNPFITFPPSPSLIPFSVSAEGCLPQSSKSDVIYALIEADLNPEENKNQSVFEVMRDDVTFFTLIFIIISFYV